MASEETERGMGRLGRESGGPCGAFLHLSSNPLKQRNTKKRCACEREVMKITKGRIRKCTGKPQERVATF